jgi:hypothetical protein
MAIQVQGSSGYVAEVGATNQAVRVECRPVEFGALGIYSAVHSSGTMAAGIAASAEVLQARWTDATRLALIQEVAITVASGSTGFTAGIGAFSVTVARAWSADGSGGTALTLTTNNQKLRTSMGTTLFGAIRGSSTAALTVGTKTLDAQAVGGIIIGIPATTFTTLTGSVLFGVDAQDHPIVLATNEGIAVRATVPATGTWQFGVRMKWAEVTSY